MLSFLLRRLNLLLITALILTIIAFAVDRIVSVNADAVVSHNGYISQYFSYLWNILNGNLGHSSVDNQALLDRGLIFFASTLELCFTALIFSSIIAIPLGLLAGLFRNTRLDYGIMTIAIIGLALPVFWVGVMAVLLPSVWGQVLPVDGNLSLIYEVPVVTGFLLIDTLMVTEQYELFAFIDRVAHLILPALVLSFFLITEIVRLTRHSMTMVMRSNYIQAAYAKGFSRTKIVFAHALKNALPPIIPQLRLQLSTIISFAMTIEIVFNLNGIGKWLFISLKTGDYLVLPAGILIISGFILSFSIFIEILMVIISPLRRGSLYADK
ncbi:MULTISPECIES: ABC transporter permease subunit [Psychromonas]|uniref:ABC transporter permease subunit n=1 Tax=Psychromonas TaxID=67572 RepID=UPI00042A012D|nr:MULTISPECIES: ABC transporter permease subunit [Psychromonas]MBB1273772.1 ABC transporter permease subunit [Psychromonas sp. SR45-3]